MKQIITLTEDEVKQAVLEKYGGESVTFDIGTKTECIDQWRNDNVTRGVFKWAIITVKHDVEAKP